MAVSVQAVLDAGVKKGDSVAIFGAGPIGLLTLLASKAMGASEIYVVDILEKRLVKAKELGAHVINSVHMDPVEEIRKYCPDGVDCSFEIAGVPATFKQTIDATKVHGIVNIVAIHTKPVEWNPIQLTRSGVSIKASMVYSPSTFKKTIHAMNDGILQPRKIVTSITELEGIIEKGFEALINNKGEAKVLVEISGEN